MLLHHFTHADLLPLIEERGLVPRADVNLMTPGDQPVVWLTEQTSLRIQKAERIGDWDKDEWLVGGTARVTVRIPTHDRKLARYIPWLKKHGAPGVDPEMASATIARHWWVYFGSIPRDQIVGCTADVDASTARIIEAA
jgi:hypothetical protein